MLGKANKNHRQSLNQIETFRPTTEYNSPQDFGFNSSWRQDL